jgi:xanthine/uracil permease
MLAIIVGGCIFSLYLMIFYKIIDFLMKKNWLPDDEIEFYIAFSLILCLPMVIVVLVVMFEKIGQLVLSIF